MILSNPPPDSASPGFIGIRPFFLRHHGNTRELIGPLNPKGTMHLAIGVSSLTRFLFRLSSRRHDDPLYPAANKGGYSWET